MEKTTKNISSIYSQRNYFAVMDLPDQPCKTKQLEKVVAHLVAVNKDLERKIADLQKKIEERGMK